MSPRSRQIVNGELAQKECTLSSQKLKEYRNNYFVDLNTVSVLHYTGERKYIIHVYVAYVLALYVSDSHVSTMKMPQ